jgi:hypothetical protein
MTLEKPYWFALAEADAKTSLSQKENRNFHFFAVVSVGVAILGGSLLINRNEVPLASASVSTISSPTITTSMKVAPAILTVAHKSVPSSITDDESENKDD